MTKIKIIGSAYPYRGGLAAYNERLAIEFQAFGNPTEIETFTIQYPSFLFPGKTQFADWEAPENLRIERTVNSINPLNWIKVGLRIKKEKPDLVIFKYWLPFMAPCFGTIIRLIKKNKHTQVICIADNIIPHESRPGDHTFTRYFLKSVDGIVAMSKSVFNDALKFEREKPIELSPHPLFDNFGDQLTKKEAIAKLGLDPDYNYLLFFGFIRDYKGLDLLLEAFSDQRIQNQKVKLIVAGEFYCKPDSYLQLIKDLQLEDSVIMKTNFIPNDQVNHYFCAADMVVQPYKTATQSGVTQIAYHFNKPMLVTNVGGLSEIIPDQKVGYVVEPEKMAIANSLVNFYLENREKKFTINVMEEKKRFSWDKMVEAVFRIYSKIIKK